MTRSFVIFGKGGIGKSTLACGLSASYAAMGQRVLDVGCDPKHDSTAPLLGGRMIEPVVGRLLQIRGATPEALVERSPLGIDCVEAGGPTAGVGCVGRGVSRMLELFDEGKLLEDGRYDVARYDVLGDVICGGFAAPLRKAVGELVVIVASVDGAVRGQQHRARGLSLRNERHRVGGARLQHQGSRDGS